MNYLITKPEKAINTQLKLTSSKSISNRVLIIQALSDEKFNIENIAEAQDTVQLKNILHNKLTNIINAGEGGTTYRFLTALLSITKGEWILTGAERIKERPVKILVDGLKQLGADIEYLEKEGYPPLKIKGKTLDKGKLSIDGSISSQFISAILMISPKLKNGLELKIENKLLSKPYIEMTLNIMKYFGVNYEWQKDTIKIQPQKYKAKNFTVEADWSSASYWYEIASLSQNAIIRLEGLSENSLQGDSVVAKIFEKLGVRTTYFDNSIVIEKVNEIENILFNYDFINCPDLVQTIAATCCGLNINGTFKGTDNLNIKETDRVKALKSELFKFDCSIEYSDNKSFKLTSKKGNKILNNKIETYNDHRIALSFAPLCLQYGSINIKNPKVVEKSYPNYWNDLKKAGFKIESYE